MANLPEYGGLGGTGGHSNLPTESEKDGAPSLTLSRLQLLGVGLTSQYTETSQVTKQVMGLHTTLWRTQWNHVHLKWVI